LHFGFLWFAGHDWGGAVGMTIHAQMMDDLIIWRLTGEALQAFAAKGAR
jgi:hypothetical protein